MIVDAVKFRTEFGWAPRYPSYREGLDQVVAQWKFDASHLRA
jgi:hypothetical protein